MKAGKRVKKESSDMAKCLEAIENKCSGVQTKVSAVMRLIDRDGSGRSPNKADALRAAEWLVERAMTASNEDQRWFTLGVAHLLRQIHPVDVVQVAAAALGLESPSRTVADPTPVWRIVIHLVAFLDSAGCLAGTDGSADSWYADRREPSDPVLQEAFIVIVTHLCREPSRHPHIYEALFLNWNPANWHSAVCGLLELATPSETTVAQLHSVPPIDPETARIAVLTEKRQPTLAEAVAIIGRSQNLPRTLLRTQEEWHTVNTQNAHIRAI